MVKKYWDVGVAVFRFLKAARNRVKDGMSKEQILDFARREFGEVSKLLRKQIDDLFKKKPTTTKKGDVVPIKEGEGIVATKKATDIAKKRTEDIAKGDVTGETSDLVKGLDDKMTGIKKAADELKEISAPENIMEQILKGQRARDPRRGVVRAAAREILNKNKVKIGREDPIDVLRQMYGEKGLEAIDAVSDGLLDAQTYGEMNTILRDNKLFDLVPKKTYGYDESVVAGEKIRKAIEEEAKQKKLLEKFRELDSEKSNPSIKKFFGKAKDFWKR